MSLATASAAVRALTEETHGLADATARLQATPTITVQLAITASDHAEADAIRRGQRPQLVTALKDQLGLERR